MEIYANKDCPHLQKALRKVKRLVPVRGELGNEQVFEMLYLHFVQGKDRYWLADLYYNDPTDETTLVAKLLAKNEGEQSSRRPDVRRIFLEYCNEAGIEVGIKRSRKKKSGGDDSVHRSGGRPVLGVFGGAGPKQDPPETGEEG